MKSIFYNIVNSFFFQYKLLKQVDCMVTVLENQVSLFFNWKLALYCKTLYKYWQLDEVAGLESTNKW